MRKRVPVLHPFFFALYPVLLVYSTNVNMVLVTDTLRPLAIALACCAGLYILYQILLRDWHRSGIIVSWNVLLFFTYGNVYYVLADNFHVNPRADVLAACWAASFIVGTWWIARKIRKISPRATQILNLVSAMAILMTGLNPAVQLVNTLSSRSANASAIVHQPSVREPTSSPRPDIYYIILDGFGREDVLNEIYGVDNSPLITYLQDKGFYVAEESHSNYMRTILSISSSLNFQYLDQMLTVTPEADNYEPLKLLLENNAAAGFLRQHGYRFVMVSGGFRELNINSADIFITRSWTGGLSDFETTLLSGSAAVLYLDQIIPKQRREQVLNTFTTVVDQVVEPGPKFIFAHIFLPHPPFLFDRNGKPVVNSGITDKEGNPIRALNINDGSDFLGDRSAYIQGYREQVMFASMKTREMIDEILSRSETPPVIILQGDHGPGAFLDWGSLQNTCVHERFSILNAIYLPVGHREGFYPQISPVNTFRLVFNNIFNADLEILEDRSVFTIQWRPYDFEEVTPSSLANLCPTP